MSVKTKTCHTYTFVINLRKKLYFTRYYLFLWLWVSGLTPIIGQNWGLFCYVFYLWFKILKMVFEGAGQTEGIEIWRIEVYRILI